MSWFQHFPKKNGFRDAENVFIWSDGKIFTLKAVTNSQNDRFLAKSIGSIPPGARIAFRRMKPASMMVWAAVSSNGKKFPLVFLEEGVKVNSEVYLKMLNEQCWKCLTLAIKINGQKLQIYTGRCTISNIKFNATVVLGPFFSFRQPRYQPDGFLYLVHSRK